MQVSWFVKLYVAVNNQDLEVFDRVVSEDFEFVDFALDETFKGREAFKNAFKSWWTAFPKGTGEILNLVASNDQVVIEVLGRGNQSGAFETSHGRIEPTNRMFELHFCQLFHIKDGKLASGRCYSDAFKIFASASSSSEDLRVA